MLITELEQLVLKQLSVYMRAHTHTHTHNNNNNKEIRSGMMSGCMIIVV